MSQQIFWYSTISNQQAYAISELAFCLHTACLFKTLTYTRCPIPSGCLRDSFGISQVPQFILGRGTLSFQPTNPIPWTYLPACLNLSWIYLPSGFLLATFFLPSFYPLSTHYFVFTKRIFSTQFITNSELSSSKIVNCKLWIAIYASPNLPRSYPLAIPTFNIRIIAVR